MKLAKKIKKHLSSGAKSAKKGLSKGLSASRRAARRAAQAAAKKALTKTTAAYLLIAIAVGSGVNVGLSKLQQRNYKQGCIDGAAIGIASLIPFAAGEIIKDRNESFGQICGQLGKLNAKGKSLEDVIK